MVHRREPDKHKDSKCKIKKNEKEQNRPWQDSNLQSPDPKSGALSIMPHDLLSDNKHVRPLEQPVFQLIGKYFIVIFR